jgi:transcriptional regulator with XRE-family HTH domain
VSDEDVDGERTKAAKPPAAAARKGRWRDERPGIWVGYGRLLKLFRERARLTQEQLADAIGYSTELVGAVERGRRPAKEQFTAGAERVLDAQGALAALQGEVDFAKLPPFFRDFGLIELDAVSRFSYDPLLVPGLLQTEAHARAVFEGHLPLLSEETVAEYLDARLNRQKLLTRTPLIDFSFVIGEAALRNPVGGGEVVREQYGQLLALGRLRNVSIQVMPTEYGVHPGLHGPMVLVETADQQRFGYFESQEIGRVVGEAQQVSTLGLRYGKLRSQALNEDESAVFIEQLAAGEG